MHTADKEGNLVSESYLPEFLYASFNRATSMNIDDNAHRKNERLFYIRMNISTMRLGKDMKKGETYDVKNMELSSIILK